jgi:dihydroflavonol-4-reductase
MTTLVTGATGFVGSAVARCLIQAGHDLRVLVRSGSDRRNLEGLACDVATGDLNDPASLDDAVAGCEALFHVAADYRLWVRDPQCLYDTNVTGTRALILAAAEAGISRIVYTSSVAALGLNADGAPANEETPVEIDHMVGHYKRSKFLAEREVLRLVREEGLPIVLVNPSAPIGPRDVKPTPTGRMVVQASTGRMPAYVDTGLNMVHVDDVAAGHLLAFDRGGVGERYILGAENMSLRHILGAIASVTGRRPPRIRLPNRPLMPIALLCEGFARLGGGGEPMVTLDALRMARKLMYFSSDKARAELGYEPRPVLEGVRDAVGWFADNGYLH